MPKQLMGVALVETDTNGETLTTYAYPTQLSDELYKTVVRKIPENLDTSYVWGSTDGIYYYVLTRELEQGEEPELQFVVRLSVIISADECYPEKYEELAQVLLATYVNTKGNANELLSHYLHGAVNGNCGTAPLEFVASDFDVVPTALKELTELFGMETILIYTAVILKKRVAVFGSDLEELSRIVRSLPFFAEHKDWTICPNVDLTVQSEVQDVTNLSTKKNAARFLGFSSEYDELASREYMYDLLVDLDDIKVVVTQGGASDLAMTKVHKKIAIGMVQWAGDEQVNELEFISNMRAATSEVTESLRKLAARDDTDGGVVAALASVNLPANLLRFYKNLATVEGL